MYPEYNTLLFELSNYIELLRLPSPRTIGYLSNGGIEELGARDTFITSFEVATN